MWFYLYNYIKFNLLLILGFRKHIIHRGYLHFGKWPLMTSNDLKRPRIRKISIQAAYSRSQDSENIPYVKSQNFQFSTPFLKICAKSTRNDPNPVKSYKTYIIDLIAPFGLTLTLIFISSYFLNFWIPLIPCPNICTPILLTGHTDIPIYSHVNVKWIFNAFCTFVRWCAGHTFVLERYICCLVYNTRGFVIL